MKEKAIKILKKPMVLIILSAILSALPFSFPSLFLLPYFSYVPLFLVIIKSNRQGSARYILKGLLFGFLFYVGIYYWFLSMHPLEYAGITGGASVGVVMLAWLGISLVHGLLWCLPFVLCKVCGRFINSPIFLGLVGIFGIIGAQKLTYVSELAFPFVRISLFQYKAPVLLQNASLFGVDGSDMLILLINLLIALALIYPIDKKRLLSLAAVTLFAVNLVFGVVRMNIVPKGESLNIVSVQGNVDTEDKWGEKSIPACFETYMSLTKENVDTNTDLVVWPESAVPVNHSDYYLYAEEYKAFTKETQVPILMGALWQIDGQKANTATYIEDGEIKERYIKREVVPFGERMPYREVLSRLFPVLKKINILGSDYLCGTQTKIIKEKKGNIGNVICLEITDPTLTRASVNDGAELMVAVTNDSWLKDSKGSYQHSSHGVLRSIESGRCFVRSANTGISLITDSRGRIIAELAPLKEGVIKEEVYFSKEKTLYMMVGDILFPIFGIGLLVFLITYLIYKKISLRS